MGEGIEIAKTLVDPANKLIDLVGGAIGKIYEPYYIRKMADAQAYKIKQIGSAITESDSLPILFENDSVSMSTTDFDDFVKRAEYRVNHQALREQQNIENIVGKAFNELLNAPKVTSEPVDEDWRTRFFSIAKEINTEEMRYIWAKILAGEVSKPGTFSMRTMEVIRNLSKEEAAIFQKILPFVFSWDNDRKFVGDNDELNKKYGIYFSDILLLDECGLLELNGISLNPQLKKGDYRYLYTDNRIVAISGTSETPKKVSLYTYRLTNAGNELFSILEHNSNQDYLAEFCECVFEKNRGKITMSIHKIVSRDESGFEYDPTVLQKFENVT